MIDDTNNLHSLMIHACEQYKISPIVSLIEWDPLAIRIRKFGESTCITPVRPDRSVEANSSGRTAPYMGILFREQLYSFERTRPCRLPKPMETIVAGPPTTGARRYAGFSTEQATKRSRVPVVDRIGRVFHRDRGCFQKLLGVL